MKRPLAVALGVAGALLLTGLGYTVFRHRDAPGADQPAAAKAEEPVARVKTVALKNGAFDKAVLVYGSAIPAPGAQSTLSVPFESRIRRIMVNEGRELNGVKYTTQVPAMAFGEMVAKAKAVKTGDHVKMIVSERKYQDRTSLTVIDFVAK